MGKKEAYFYDQFYRIIKEHMNEKWGHAIISTRLAFEDHINPSEGLFREASLGLFKTKLAQKREIIERLEVRSELSRVSTSLPKNIN